MWAPVLATALGTAQWLVEQKRQRQAERTVPVQLLTDGYFDAMAEDIQGRVGEGQDLKRALRDIYAEQGPVTLQPAPKDPIAKKWILAGAIAGAVAVGLAYWRRR